MSSVSETALAERLSAHGQGHLVHVLQQLNDTQRATLSAELNALNLDGLDVLIERYVRTRPNVEIAGDLQPAPCIGPDDSKLDEAREAGLSLIAAGKVAAFTVAGGQGTRLGWAGPKGTFPATAVTGKSLFQCFAEQIRATQERHRITVPWYIMTSPLNDAASREFFLDNNCFGLNRSDIFMFPQGTMPSMEMDTGRLLLAAPDALATNPDGHGGSIRALADSGALDDMAGRGIEQISYFQVDNPLVRVLDPTFVGLHALDERSSGEMSSKMVPKAHAAEKVGVFCARDGRTVVIEYSDLPDELAQQVDENNALRFRAGSIAIHLMSVAFVRRLTEAADGFALPWHRAEKVVPFVDPESMQLVKPDAPNAVKLESFVFDALAFADRSIVYETDRAAEFAPIKNASGADSAESSRQMQSDLYGRWMEDQGVRVPRDADGHVDAVLEISPLTADAPEELAGLALPPAIGPGTSLAF